MMDPIFAGFTTALEKTAVSPALMQRMLAGRAAQGVGGAAALGRQVAGAAAGGATTSRQVMGQLGGLGRHRLQGVAQSGLAARQTAQTFGPAKAGLQSRIQAAESMVGKHDYAQPLKVHEGYMGGEHAYSPQYANAIARPQGALQDPKGLLAARPTPRPVSTGGTALQQPMATASTRLAPTLVGAKPQGATVVTRRPLAPQVTA